MVQYKTFDQKHYTVFVKKDPQPAKLLFGFPHYRAQKKSCRKLYIWVSKPIRGKIQEQWKKN